MRRRVGAALVMVTCVSACLFPSLGGLADGSDAGLDAAFDAPNASDAGDASSTAFCDGTGSHYFCADFDESTSLAQWTTTLVSSDTVAPTLDNDCVSAPHSLLSTLPVASADTFARLMKALPQTTSSVHLTMSFKQGNGVCEAKPESYYEVVKFGGNDGTGVEIKFDSTGWFLDLDSDQSDGGETHTLHYFTHNPTIGVWSPLTVDIVFSTTVGSVIVSIDGTNALDIEGIDTLSNGHNTSMIVGLYSTGFCSPNTMRVDNMLLDITQ